MQGSLISAIAVSARKEWESKAAEPERRAKNEAVRVADRVADLHERNCTPREQLLQPTKRDYCLQRLSVLLRKRMIAKVRGIVQRARDALLGGPNGTFDEGFEGDDDRVERMGDMLANIIR